MPGSPPDLFTEIPEPDNSGSYGSARIQHGPLIVPQQQILLYSADEWERFIQEWVHSQKSNYSKVLKFSGANDMGIDVAGFCDDKELFGVWDNFQCKHYYNALAPTTAILELGKILWYSFNKQYAIPKKHYFIAPKDCGIKLKRLLGDSNSLKKYLFKNWANYCAEEITKTKKIELTGDFKKYAEDFDYSIFSSRSTLEILDDHRKTPWFATRFGGGLPDRPDTVKPPNKIADMESRYISQLFEAYSDHKREAFSKLDDLNKHNELINHYNRQREYFYNAEALRNFARDTVPPGTFQHLQDEVHSGVVDIESASHPDAYARLNSVTTTASTLQLTANALISVVKIQDRKGICHQLANDDRLLWKKE